MTTLLYITAHPLQEEDSRSLAAGAVFLKAYRELHPEDEIVELDLFKSGVPEIDADLFNAWGKLRKGADLTSLSPEEQLKAGRHVELSDQFVAAGKIVFVNPMWNHFLPPVLKTYTDALCVAGKTFRYTAQGPVGLLGDKKVLHIQSAGGVYDRNAGEVKDFGHAYLAHIMHFFGITDIQSLFVEGMDANPAEAPAIREQAARKAVELAGSF
jgi:FMN-dependent NADH-azoreductase